MRSAELPVEASISDPIIDPWDRPREPVKNRRAFASVGVVMLGLLSIAVPLGAAGAAVYFGPSIPGRARDAWNDLFTSGEKKRAQIIHLHDDVERRRDFTEPGTVDAPLPIPHEPQSPSGAVPKQTESKDVGQVKIVMLGTGIQSLKSALSEQQRLAKASGKEVLVMTSDSSCKPCNGFLQSISSPLMQDALSPVIIVNVNTEVFGEEMKQLHMDAAMKPWFFLLGSSLSPRDGINGGEWGDDVAENIAPVVGPFVRGHYDKRKSPFKAQTGGMFL